MKIEFIEKDKIYQNETTNYWFLVDDELFALSDCNGDRQLLDCDGCPIAECNEPPSLKDTFEDMVDNEI